VPRSAARHDGGRPGGRLTFRAPSGTDCAGPARIRVVVEGREADERHQAQMGECSSARDAFMQQLQALLRIVVYNLHRQPVLGILSACSHGYTRYFKVLPTKVSTEQGALR